MTSLGRIEGGEVFDSSFFCSYCSMIIAPLSQVKPLFNLLIRNNNTFARIWHYCSKFIYSQISLLIYFCGWHIYEQIKFIEITRLRYCYDFRTWYMCRGYLPRSFPSPSLGCYYIITLKWIRENKIRRWIHPEIVCYMNELLGCFQA